MSEFEISGGARTKYRGSKEDWEPTKKFVEAWRDEIRNALRMCHIRIADVNYATDPKVDGARTAHYEIETYFGITQWRNLGGGLMQTRENPTPWFESNPCLSVNMIRPYIWFNSECTTREHGYMEIYLEIPTDRRYPESMPDTAEMLIEYAKQLESGYTHMIDTEYAGSSTELVARNEDAKFSITISLSDQYYSQ